MSNHDHYVERLVDLLDPALNHLLSPSLDEARAALRSGSSEAIRNFEGSFALVAQQGKTVRMARSLDRPMRYFLAKRQEGPALFVGDRIDRIRHALNQEGLGDQFHPSYTRMIPAHHIAEINLVGCPDPSPTYSRFFTPRRDWLPPDLDELGRLYIGTLADEIQKWLGSIPEGEPIGIAFSGGIDSGAVFVLSYHLLRKLGMNPGRLKAFTLSLGDGPDVDQARRFLDRMDLGLFLEVIEASPDQLDATAVVNIIEDYKPLDIECAMMGLALCHGIRERYPDWRYLVDGDGGDENLKDYPIEENHELTIRSVVDNLMLYHEGWGVGRLKHSLTYSGGLSRAYVRTYAPVQRFGFEGFSPYTRPNVIEIAEGIPFAALTRYDVPTLYSLKGEIVRRGLKEITGYDMPVFEKRRFQHGATRVETLRQRIPFTEADYRRHFMEQHAGIRAGLG